MHRSPQPGAVAEGHSKMYEQVSHSLLNRILDQLRPDVRKRDLRHFYTRLGANFYAIYSLFQLLYGKRDDFDEQMRRVVEVMTLNYIQRRNGLKKRDRRREFDHNWFLSQEWVAMALYTNSFADDLNGLGEKLRLPAGTGCQPAARDAHPQVSARRQRRRLCR